MKMRKGRLRCYGHVMRRDQEYVGRRVMEMELPRKRKGRRLKRRFVDVVKEDMGEVGSRKMDIKTRQFEETSYAVATSDRRKRLKEEDN